MEVELMLREKYYVDYYKLDVIKMRNDVLTAMVIISKKERSLWNKAFNSYFTWCIEKSDDVKIKSNMVFFVIFEAYVPL
jgi:hypothetical protein